MFTIVRANITNALEEKISNLQARDSMYYS